MPKGSPGQPKSPEHRARIAAALKGQAKPPEHRQAISEAMKKRPRQASPGAARTAVNRAIGKGQMPRPSVCTFDPSHPGPFEYDHCGDPPYALENYLTVQPLCIPCHRQVEVERRDGRGYPERPRLLRTCERCLGTFPVIPGRAAARWCSWACRYPGRNDVHG